MKSTLCKHHITISWPCFRILSCALKSSGFLIGFIYVVCKKIHSRVWRELDNKYTRAGNCKLFGGSVVAVIYTFSLSKKYNIKDCIIPTKSNTTSMSLCKNRICYIKCYIFKLPANKWGWNPEFCCVCIISVINTSRICSRSYSYKIQLLLDDYMNLCLLWNCLLILCLIVLGGKNVICFVSPHFLSPDLKG